MVTENRIEREKSTTFEGRNASDSTVVRHILHDDTAKDLKPEVAKEINSYKRAISVKELSETIDSGDRGEVSNLINWNNIGYDGTRTINRAGLVAAGLAGWKFRDYLPEANFIFNQNSPQIDRALAKISRDRISAYNRQERKRLNLIISEGKRLGWSSNRIADEFKLSAGINSVQQRALYNLQKGLLAENVSPGAIKKQSSEYIARARNYRNTVTAEWLAASVVNEGQLQLWDQLEREEFVSSDTFGKEWEAILDDVTGTPDRAMNGQIVRLDQNFVDPTLTHAPLPRPPLRSNCRCGIKLSPLP